MSNKLEIGSLFSLNSLVLARVGSSGGCRVLVLALLELYAERLMLVKVFLLALNVAVHDDTTVVAVYLAGCEANRTDGEIGSYILTRRHFIRH